jgi:sugar phosphate isomerase/epimerase
VHRREFIAGSLAAAAIGGRQPESRFPRFAHRQAQMPLPPGQSVFEFAKKIPGLSGVQLQMIWRGDDISANSRALTLKQEARDNGILTPSLAGIWKQGENVFGGEVAERVLTNAIRTAASLEAGVILVAMFRENCPNMTDPKSYGPVVDLFRKFAPRAADVNTKLCVETTLLPEEDRELVEMVDHPAMGVYYDATNTETNHPGWGVPGIRILRKHIGEVHLKNEDRLLSQQPSKVNWPDAIRQYRDIHYNHWFCFETEHISPARCIEDTVANITFVRQQLSA